MLKKAISTINKNGLINKNDNIVIGISGGADSVALLHLLLNIKGSYNLKLTAVHINHNLRGENALKDENFVKKMCEELGVCLEVFSVNVKEISLELKTSIEDAARIARYKCFNKVLQEKKADIIAVAHHKNDNAENFLIRLFRGSGIVGLSALKYKNENVIRPFLDITRKEIETFLNTNKIEYVTDETNLEEIYLRNLIRNSLIPFIEEKINPNIVEALNRSSKLLFEDSKFLENESEKYYETVLVKENVLDVNRLKELPYAIATRIVRKAIANINSEYKNISFENINDVYELIYKKSGSCVDLLNSIKAVRVYDRINLTYEQIKEYEYCYNFTINTALYIKEIDKNITILDKATYDLEKGCCTKIISCDKILFGEFMNFQIRSRKQGDKIYVAKMGGHKKISKYLKDLKIPINERGKTALLCLNDKVVMIIDEKLIVSDDFSYNEDAETFYIYIS